MSGHARIAQNLGLNAYPMTPRSPRTLDLSTWNRAPWLKPLLNLGTRYVQRLEERIAQLESQLPREGLDHFQLSQAHDPVMQSIGVTDVQVRQGIPSLLLQPN